MAQLTVKTVLASSGERLPVLLDRSTGLPVFYPNLYALTELRQTNRASATIERALRELAVLFDFLFDAGIDLADRLRKGHLLTMGEIDGLARYCRQSFKSSQDDNRSGAIGSVRVFKMAKNCGNPTKTVSHVTAANRLRTIHAYLTWLISLSLSHVEQSKAARESLKQAKEDVLPFLRARIPSAKGRNSLGMRQGLLPDALERLLQVVVPGSPDNPWRSAFSRQRNALIVCWLSQLGLRRGELLNVKIPDIDFRKNEVLIARRADDPEDPRRDQPKVKTRDRILPLSDELAGITHNYITKDRVKILGARKHSYLFVAEYSGAPMALTTLNKMFQVLRLKIHDLPNDLSAHMLRHTWNDEFSRIIEGNGLTDAKNEQIRCYFMGWAPNSPTARTYTRRYVEDKARQASLDLQKKAISVKKNEK